ncbi:hypothetical protein AJ80_01878 [Polytolypa hystricis UAMH7299]|uniref:NmrA-like domain-containing protein n=1 Tax=Polytolypa hystricis (strain UAMH7299) TaxID=1447883 RepID=A0A2B7YZ14_POLH7|nr:hypothetical protein AJ80_01878 [Polytolypa hystricis UAMH7299]
MSKLICILGITGNQGGSVAQRFLTDPNYRVRGITRNPTSPTATNLAAQGVEIVKADVNDIDSLIPAFANANLIFSVTNYWEPFFRPDCRTKAAEQGISCRRFAYDVEFQQGRNIADAVARTVDTLDENGFIASTLSHARKSSGGKFDDLYHFDSKADVFPDYVREKYPELEKKMSLVQTGFFTSSYNLAPQAYMNKQEDGSFQMLFPTNADKLIPHFEVNADTGNFVYAVSQLPPGKAYMAAGTFCSWSEYMRLWSKATGQRASYREITLDEFIALFPTDPDTGREIGIMLVYSSDPGYDGGDEGLWKAEDIGKAGIECPMTTLEEWMAKEDWSMILSK